MKDVGVKLVVFKFFYKKYLEFICDELIFFDGFIWEIKGIYNN